jgi:hypothetical protein
METIIIAFAPGVLEKAVGDNNAVDVIVESVKKRMPDVDFHIKIEQPPNGNLVDILYTDNEDGERVLADVLWCITDELMGLIKARVK